MQALRQLGVGVIIAIISVVLVLGGIFLSLAETLPPAATPTQIPPTFPQSFPTPTTTQTPFVQVGTSTETASPSPTPTTVTAASFTLTPAVVSCTPPSGWIRINTTTADTIYSLAQRYKSTAENLSAANCLTSFDLPAGFALYVPPVPTVTVIPCGPPSGWVRAYSVRPGDTLYRVAISYGLSYPQLQRANCMGSSTTIYTGQRLWVPNVPTRTPIPGVTSVPNFPTDTLTSVPPTTAVPPTNTATNPPPATATQPSIPTITDTPITPPPSE